MHPVIWSVLLLAFGLALAMLEVFIPSAGILGFLSLSAIVTAIVLAFSFSGTNVGFLFLGIAAISLPATVIMAFKWLPSTPFGRRLMLGTPQDRELLPDDDPRAAYESLIGNHGTNLTGGSKQHGGLAANNLEIGRLIGGQIAGGVQLHDLALGDGGRCLRQDAQHLERAIGDHQLKCAGEQEVADQNAGLVAEYLIGRGLTAPLRALIDHIVMEQGRGMDELDTGSEAIMPVTGIVAQIGTGEGQQRAQALATCRHHILRQLWDQWHRGLHTFDDQMVDLLQRRFKGRMELL